MQTINGIKDTVTHIATVLWRYKDALNVCRTDRKRIFMITCMCCRLEDEKDDINKGQA